ncbi:hypothetical protein MIDIC_10059 [Alphaproteobacteria bacterium]
MGAGFNNQAAYDAALQKAKGIADNKGVTSHLANAISHRDEIQYTENMGEERRLSNQINTSLSDMSRSRAAISFHSDEAKKLQQMKVMEDNLQIGYNKDITNELENYAANRKDIAGNPLGRAKALQILNGTDDRFVYAKEQILNDFYKEQVSKKVVPYGGQAGSTESQLGSLSQAYNREDRSFEQKKNNKKKEFLSKVANESNAPYGQFNAEQAQLQQVDGAKAYNTKGSVYYNSASEKQIMEEGGNKKHVALTISDDVSGAEFAKKYQSFTPEKGERTDIVFDVRLYIKDTANEVKQERASIEKEEQQLSSQYAKETDTSRIAKVVGSTAGSVAPLLKFVGKSMQSFDSEGDESPYPTQSTVSKDNFKVNEQEQNAQQASSLINAPQNTNILGAQSATTSMESTKDLDKEEQLLILNLT